MKENLILLAKLLATDNAFNLAFSSKVTSEEKYELSKTKITSLTHEDFSEFLEKLQETQEKELSPEELEQIAGGGLVNKLATAALLLTTVVLPTATQSASAMFTPETEVNQSQENDDDPDYELLIPAYDRLSSYRDYVESTENTVQAGTEQRNAPTADTDDEKTDDENTSDSDSQSENLKPNEEVSSSDEEESEENSVSDGEWQLSKAGKKAERQTVNQNKKKQQKTQQQQLNCQKQATQKELKAKVSNLKSSASSADPTAYKGLANSLEKARKTFFVGYNEQKADALSAWQVPHQLRCKDGFAIIGDSSRTAKITTSTMEHILFGHFDEYGFLCGGGHTKSAKENMKEACNSLKGVNAEENAAFKKIIENLPDVDNDIQRHSCGVEYLDTKNLAVNENNLIKTFFPDNFNYNKLQSVISAALKEVSVTNETPCGQPCEVLVEYDGLLVKVCLTVTNIDVSTVKFNVNSCFPVLFKK